MSNLYREHNYDRPDHRECERRVYMHEQRRDFIRVMENKAVSPSDNSTSERAV
jgi:hypothetical protein